MRALIGVLVAGLLAAGCGSDDSPAGGAAGGAAGAAGMAGAAGAGGSAGASGSAGSGGLESVASLSGDGQGAAFAPDNNDRIALFVTLTTTGQLAKVDSGSAVGAAATIPSPNAIARRADGNLLITGRSSDDSQDVVWLLERGVGSSVFAQGDATRPFVGLTGIAIAPDDRVVVSDAGGGAIFRIEANGTSPSIVTSLVSRPGPLAFSADGSELFVVSQDTGVLWSVPRDSRIGTFGPPVQLGGSMSNATSLMVLDDANLLAVGQNFGVFQYDPVARSGTQIGSPSELGQPVAGAFGIDAFGDDLYLITGSTVGRLALDRTGIALPVR